MSRPRVYCVVYGCFNSSYAKPHLSFFKLPADVERRTKWLRLIYREDLANKPPKSYTVCQEHFNVLDVLPGKKRKKLKRNTLPSLRLPDLQKKDGHTLTEAPKLAEKSEDDEEAPESSASAASVTRSKARGTHCADNVKKSTQDREVSDQLLHLEHTDYKCNECGGDIAGFRYVCVECAEGDVCAACEARGAHAQHYLLRVPRGKPRHEATEIVKIIRQFMNTEKRESQTEPTEGLLSIKCEVEIPNDPLEGGSIVKIEPLEFDELEDEDEATDQGDAQPAEPERRQRRKRKTSPDTHTDTLPDTRIRISLDRVTEVTAKRTKTQSSRHPVPSYSNTNEQTPPSYEVPADIKPIVDVPVTFDRVSASVDPSVRSVPAGGDRGGLRPAPRFVLPTSARPAQVVAFDPSQPAESLVIKTELPDDS